jgi:phage terminase small subunit
MPLTPKQTRFVAEYLVDLNATQAAIRAGYSAKTAEQLGYQLLQHPSVSAAVSRGTAKAIARTDISASRVLEELRRLAFIDMRGYYDEQGNLKPIHALNDEQGAALAGMEVIIKNAKAGDGVTDEIHKFKVWDKTRALEMLAKHFKLLTDVVKIEDAHALEGRLTAARNRLAKAKGEK